MYQSFCNDFIDQYLTEIGKFDKTKHLLKPSKQLDDYKRFIEISKIAIHDIKNAVKFKIPACDQLMPEDENPTKTALNFIQEANLPFPSIAIELESESVGEHQNCDMIVVAKQVDEYINIYAYNKTETWQIMEHDCDVDVIHVQFNRFNFESRLIGFDSSQLDDDKISSMGNWFLGVPLRAVLNLLCTLSCTNTQISDHPVKASKLKNDLRKKKKKLPFFEFKILTIDSDKPRSNNSTHSNGTQSGKRVHLRRGHIRKLAKGNVWVNACVVGDKSKGSIEKEYLVL